MSTSSQLATAPQGLADSNLPKELKLEVATVGQSTRNCQVGMGPKTKCERPGRHPNPPTGNNKKLKHACPFEGCPWKFATPYKLRRHIKSHTKETPYLCSECGRGFSVRYNLLMHIQTIHSQPHNYKCPVRGCQEAFHSQPRLNGHLRRVHKKDNKTVDKSDRCDSRGNSTSSMDCGEDSSSAPTGATTRSTRQRRRFECTECSEEFSSQAKLTFHSRACPSKVKSHECSTEGCEEKFNSHEKMLKHLECHKTCHQYKCPHDNCNRVFLHQTHFKNHLKIHTQDHHFVCPVLDCHKKFGCESDYNSHLNTHINYGYRCPQPDCELSFLSKKRLSFHSQVVHGTPGPEGAAGSSFLEGIQPHLGARHQEITQLLTTPPCSPLFPYAPPTRPEPASHEFIKNIDIPGRSQRNFQSILSANKDWSVQQIEQFIHSAVDLSEIETRLSPASAGYESDSGYSTYDVSPLTTHAPVSLAPQYALHHGVGPMFNPFSPDAFQSPASSPCSTEVGFFSPQQPLPITPIQHTAFFPGDMAVPSIYQSFPPGMGYVDEASYSRVPVPCRRNSDSQVVVEESRLSHTQSGTRSLPNMEQVIKLEPAVEKSRETDSSTSSDSNIEGKPLKGVKKPKKSKKNKKNSFPRFMNKASMIAFRQHILNKLKRGQEATENCSSVVKQEAASPKVMCEQEIPTQSYEVKVEVQQNHSSENRSQSEPIDSSNSPQAQPALHSSHSEGNLSKETPDSTTEHLNQLFSEDMFNINPFLSGAEEEQMLKTLGFHEGENAEISTFLGVDISQTPIPPSDVMDLDCIQDLLKNDDAGSPLNMINQELNTGLFPDASSPLPTPSPVSIGYYPQYSVPVDTLVTAGYSYPLQPQPLYICQDYGVCAPEVFDI